jgi:membrane-bound lytic murein transglycosylase D
MLSIKSLNQYGLSLTMLLLLSACSGPFTPVKPDNAERSASKESPNIVDTPWHRAYGKRQETSQNRPVNYPNIESEDIALPLPTIDLWQRIRNGYGIEENTLNPETQKQLDWFASRPDYINTVADRAKPYLYYIVDELEKRNMPLELAFLPVIESSFQPLANSSSNASGLWQFMPATGRVFGLDQNWWYDGRRDIIQSTDAALDYLQKLHTDFGDWQLALAAYNSGEGTVGRAIKHNQERGMPTDFWSLNLPKETTNYVPKFMAIAHLLNEPADYNLTLNSIEDTPFFTVVDTGSQIDLALAAKLAEISTDEIHQLNPGFNRSATAPNGPHRIVVPLDKADIFQQGLDDLAINKQMNWTKHTVASGDSLQSISKRYKTTVTAIKKANGLVKSNLIRLGSNLLIPTVSNSPNNSPTTTSTQQTANQQRVAPTGHKQIYAVNPGDTWWDIAIKHSIDVMELAQWNDKSPKDLLSVGQKLVIWTKIKSIDNKTKKISYITKSGDSLWKISQRFKVSVAQLLDWNGLSDRSLLRPGQLLTVHVVVTTQNESTN